MQIDAPPSPDRYREVWLINADGQRMYPLGVLPDDGRATYPLPPALAGQLQGFNIVDVSIEPYDGNPAHSRESQVRGSFRPKAGFEGPVRKSPIPAGASVDNCAPPREAGGIRPSASEDDGGGFTAQLRAARRSARALNQSRSLTTMDCSREGPTPMPEIRAPQSSSIRFTYA